MTKDNQHYVSCEILLATFERVTVFQVNRNITHGHGNGN